MLKRQLKWKRRRRKDLTRAARKDTRKITHTDAAAQLARARTRVHCRVAAAGAAARLRHAAASDAMPLAPHTPTLLRCSPAPHSQHTRSVRAPQQQLDCSNSGYIKCLLPAAAQLEGMEGMGGMGDTGDSRKWAPSLRAGARGPGRQQVGKRQVGQETGERPRAHEILFFAHAYCLCKCIPRMRGGGGGTAA